MKSEDSQKICVSCEGRIPLNADTCRYCGTNQNMNESAPLFQNQSLEDSLTSLYTPPYQGKRPNFEKVQSHQMELDEALAHEESGYKGVAKSRFADPFSKVAGENEDEERRPSALWPTILLVAGSNFFLLGLMQLFFSKNGWLRLEWDASHWFFYWLLSAPLLFFGVKRLKNL